MPNMLTVVVPVYNESATLRTALERLLKVELPLPVETIVVDDASTDDGAASITDLVESGSIKLVRHPRNLGKGAAIRTGIGHAEGDILTVLDGDLEYDPSDYRALLRPILEGEASVVYGTRSFGSHTAYSFWFVVGNWVLGKWASFLFNTWLSDVETCFKMAETEVWRSLRLRSGGFGIEAEATGKFLRSGHRIYEVPIRYTARTREAGKKLRWTEGIAALGILLRVRFLGD
jgi:glycosyltransferase involved in cell wall biosynthesis